VAWQAATKAAVLRDEGSNVRRSYVSSPDGFVDAFHGYHICRALEVMVLLREEDCSRIGIIKIREILATDFSSLRH